MEAFLYIFLMFYCSVPGQSPKYGQTYCTVLGTCKNEKALFSNTHREVLPCCTSSAAPSGRGPSFPPPTRGRQRNGWSTASRAGAPGQAPGIPCQKTSGAGIPRGARSPPPPPGDAGCPPAAGRVSGGRWAPSGPTPRTRSSCCWGSLRRTGGAGASQGIAERSGEREPRGGLEGAARNGSRGAGAPGTAAGHP